MHQSSSYFSWLMAGKKRRFFSFFFKWRFCGKYKDLGPAFRFLGPKLKARVWYLTSYYVNMAPANLVYIPLVKWSQYHGPA